MKFNGKLLTMFGLFIAFLVIMLTLYLSSTKVNISCIEDAELFQFERVASIELNRDVYCCYKNLLQKGKKQHFEELLNSNNVVANAYGFYGLYSLSSKESEKMNLLKSHIYQDEKIKVKHFDVVYQTTVGNLYLDIAIDSLSPKSKTEITNYIKANRYKHIDLSYFKDRLL